MWDRQVRKFWRGAAILALVALAGGTGALIAYLIAGPVILVAEASGAPVDLRWPSDASKLFAAWVAVWVFWGVGHLDFTPLDRDRAV